MASELADIMSSAQKPLRIKIKEIQSHIIKQSPWFSALINFDSASTDNEISSEQRNQIDNIYTQLHEPNSETLSYHEKKEKLLEYKETALYRLYSATYNDDNIS